MFRHNEEVPLIYDITKRNKTQFQITIPKAVYRAAFGKVPHDALKEHFSIGKCIEYTEQEDCVLLSYNALSHREFIMQGLNRIFNWLNNDDYFAFADNEQKQIMTCTVASTGLAVSFAPWSHEYFRNEAHAPYLFSYAEMQMKEMWCLLMNRKEDNGYTQCIYANDGFHFMLFGNGLWLAGNYRDNEFDTHNCDTHIDQTIFFTGCIALCDALKHYLKTGNYLT